MVVGVGVQFWPMPAAEEAESRPILVGVGVQFWPMLTSEEAESRPMLVVAQAEPLPLVVDVEEPWPQRSSEVSSAWPLG